MTKSQLIDSIAQRAPHVPHREVEAIVNAVFDCMADALTRGQRIEIRGFGSFSVKVRPAREGRNPKTGERVKVPERRTLGFIAGKELRDRLNPEATTSAPTAISDGSAGSSAGSHSTTPEPMAAAGGAGPRYSLN